MRRGERTDCFRGGHSGYERLGAPVSHARSIVADKDRPRVLVHDRIAGEGRHELVWRFHLDPAVAAEIRGDDVRLSHDGGVAWLMPHVRGAALALSLADGWVSPGYGVKVPTTVVVWSATTALPVDASFLFADAHVSHDERVELALTLAASVC